MSGRYGHRALALDRARQTRDAWNPWQAEREAKARRQKTQAQAHREWQEHYKRQDEEAAARRKALEEEDRQKREAAKAKKGSLMGRIGRAINPFSNFKQEREAQRGRLNAERVATEQRYAKESEKFQRDMDKMRGKGGPLQGYGKGTRS
jgi:hypothetical protein